MRKIMLEFKPLPLRGTIYSRHYLQAHKKKLSLEDKARSEAKKIIKQASKDALQIEADARRKGVEAGLSHVFELISNLLADQKNKEIELYNKLLSEVSERLSDFFSEDQLFIATIKKWQQTCANESELNRTELLIPEIRKHQSKQIISIIKETNGFEPTICHHAGDFYAIKNGDQILRLDPKGFISETCNEKLWQDISASDEIKMIYENFIHKLSDKVY